MAAERAPLRGTRQPRSLNAGNLEPERGATSVIGVLGVVALGLARAQGEGPSSRVVGPVAGAAAPQVIALRLRPGADLRAELSRVTRERGLEAAWVSTCVGSLTKVTRRFANQPDGTTLEGHFEIVSLVGTDPRLAPAPLRLRR